MFDQKVIGDFPTVEEGRPPGPENESPAATAMANGANSKDEQQRYTSGRHASQADCPDSHGGRA
jgi:hypothetical protein